MSISSHLERIELLETKLAFQDDTIEQLNQSIVDLNAEIMSLKGELFTLAEKLLNQSDNTTDLNTVEIPPHY
jgi:SlyX protein